MSDVKILLWGLLRTKLNKRLQQTTLNTDNTKTEFVSNVEHVFASVSNMLQAVINYQTYL